jgi:hypothetical protein
MYNVSIAAPSVGGAKEFQVDTGGTLTTGLVGYCKMEANSDDYWVPSNVGSDTDVVFGPLYGKVNNGGSYDGSLSHSALTNDIILDGLSAWSVAAWVNLNILPGAYTCIASNVGAFGDNFILGTTAGDTWRWFVNGVDASTTPATTGGWVYLVGTWDGINARLYVNNSLVETTPVSGAFSNLVPHPMAIGAAGAGSEMWDGYIDEMGWWSKCLTATEVNDLWNGGSGQTMVTQLGDYAVRQTGWGENSSPPGQYYYFIDDLVSVGGSGIKIPSYGSDGSANPYIRAGTDGNGVGFIEIETYFSPFLFGPTSTYNFTISISYEWTT